MGIEINLSDLKLSGNSGVLNHANLKTDDLRIDLKGLDLSEESKVLENLEINPVLDELVQQVQSMDKNSSEYSAIQKILSVERWNKDRFIEHVKTHITNFSEGVLASIVANLLTR